MLFTCSLNSGSNGNCYYIGNHSEAVLIDAGLSCRETEKRMHSKNLHPGTIKAIFISHEHTDHIKGLQSFVMKYRIPVYITPATLKNSRLSINCDFIFPFSDAAEINIGGLQIIPFKKIHDAEDPHSFVVKGNGVTIGVFTDLGVVCGKTKKYFSECNAVYLESNYDEDLLQNGKYPHYLKQRIKGGKGHLSNTQALELFRNFRRKNLSHIFLSHLSRENNCPETVLDLFKKYSGPVHVSVASREGCSDLFSISPAKTSLNYFQPSLF